MEMALTEDAMVVSASPATIPLWAALPRGCAGRVVTIGRWARRLPDCPHARPHDPSRLEQGRGLLLPQARGDQNRPCSAKAAPLGSGDTATVGPVDSPSWSPPTTKTVMPAASSATPTP